MSKKGDDSYIYCLVEEGFKKNRATDRLRIFLSAKISERAEIEMHYIKQLQTWINGLTLPMENPDRVTDYYLDNEIVRKILNCLCQEATLIIEHRQKTYIQIMSDEGPFCNLNNVALLMRDCPKSIADIEEKFKVMNDKRKDIDKQFTKHDEVKEHLRHLIDDLENHLSQRSRIISSRRPTSRTGTRKIDEMKSKLSSLRRQSAEEDEKVEMVQKEQQEIYKVAKKTLEEMDDNLQEIEARRMQLILEQIKLYLNYIQNIVPQRSALLNNQVLLDQLNLNSVESLLKAHWMDVRENAKSAKNGDNHKITAMFEVSSLRTKTCPESRVNKECENSTRKNNSVSGDSTKRMNEFLRNSKKSDSELSADENDMEAYGTVNFNSGDRLIYANGCAQRTESQESIETYLLPPETRCPAEISRIEPNKQFVGKIKLTARDSKIREIAHFTEYSTVTRFEQDDSEDVVDCLNVGELTNVRVIAIEDNTPPPGSSELAFKTGQLIKQKSAQNEQGFCYGWTREHRLARKQYGYYNPRMVNLFKKDDN